MNALLAMREVSVRYRDGARELVALDRVSFDVLAGELVGVYGERRAGKSTMLRVAAGLRKPDDGAVELDGRDLARLSARQRPRLWRRGGVALASCGLAPLSSAQPVVEHVALPLTGEGLTLREGEGLAREALRRLAIDAIAQTRIDRLSLSDRVRVELARAIVREPRLLLVDEPSVLPGPSDARQLQGVLRSLVCDDGIAVLIASEDLNALAGIPRLLTLADGRLRSTDSRRRVIPFPGAHDGAGERDRRALP